MANLLKASFRGFSFWAIDWVGPDGRRIIKHKVYARNGVETEDTGSDGRDEQVVGSLTVAEFKQFRAIVHETKIGQFTHPRLGSWRARANIGTRKPDPEDVNKLIVEMSFTEDTTQPPTSPYDDDTHTSKKNQAANLFAEADDTMDGSPGNDDTQTLYAAFQAARVDYDAQVESQESGIAGWQDVERALGTMKITGWAVVDHLRAFDTYQEDASEVISNINRGLHLAHEYVEAIKAAGQRWFQVWVQDKPQDLYSLCKDIYKDAPAEGLQQAAAIQARNDLLDAFYIPVNTVLEFPVL